MVYEFLFSLMLRVCFCTFIIIKFPPFLVDYFQVARGLNGDPSGSDSLIHIPPPRPKRKPAHPYPRKSLDARVISNSYQSERSPSPNYSSMEKATGSPTSVLSAICSEGQQSGSLSPTSCTTKQTCISLTAAVKVSSASEEDEFVKGCFSLTRKKLLSTVSYLFL